MKETAKKIYRLSVLLGALGVLGGSLQLNLSSAVAQQIVGVGSCTSVGCHGGTRPQSIVGSEYSVWVSQDPHARAYSALYDERSLRMVRQLNFQPAHQEHRCLVCHSMTHAPPADPSFDVLSDGVGCEACHGPASQWIGEHYPRRTSPQGREQLRRLGMWDTDSLLTRTQVCVECHVGGPGREVNHDLIAAGHPRLQFEMGAYFAALPKHWIDANDRASRTDDFDAKLWALGQVSTSQAALEQLARRAAPGHIWPEFSEWSCSACHHDLRDVPETQQRVAAKGALSGRRIEWDTWNHFMTRGRTSELSTAFGLNSNERALAIDANIESLAARMRHLTPNRQQVADLAHRAASELGLFAAELEPSPIKPQNLERLIGGVLQSKSATADWSTAAQTYNALATLQETRLRAGASRQGGLTDNVQQLYNALVAAQQKPDDEKAAFNPKQLSDDFTKAGRQLNPTDGSQ
jgi:hypothetical protein